MNIRGFLPTSLNEWPGKVSAVIWTAGCNFRCPFCQNKELVLEPEKLKRFYQEKILADLKQRRDWLDAVVVTGGEPTLSGDLSEFLSRCKQIGLLTMIETNGTRPRILEKLFQVRLIERISMDLKADFDCYSQAAGIKVAVNKIKESVKLIINSGLDFEFRTTVVPTLHTKQSLVKLARQLKNLVSSFESPVSVNWFFQQFIPKKCLDPKFEKIKPYSEKELKQILLAVQKYIPKAKLKGV